VNPGSGPILGVLGDADTLGDLVGRGKADAVDLLGQGVRVLLRRLNGVAPVGLENAHSPPGTDAVAMQEQHDPPDLHALVPGGRDPFPALGADAIDRFQVGRFGRCRNLYGESDGDLGEPDQFDDSSGCGSLIQAYPIRASDQGKGQERKLPVPPLLPSPEK